MATRSVWRSRTLTAPATRATACPRTDLLEEQLLLEQIIAVRRRLAELQSIGSALGCIDLFGDQIEFVPESPDDLLVGKILDVRRRLADLIGGQAACPDACADIESDLVDQILDIPSLPGAMCFVLIPEERRRTHPGRAASGKPLEAATYSNGSACDDTLGGQSTGSARKHSDPSRGQSIGSARDTLGGQGTGSARKHLDLSCEHRLVARAPQPPHWNIPDRTSVTRRRRLSIVTDAKALVAEVFCTSTVAKPAATPQRKAQRY
ncbi:hypothetical protein T492DRAFT_1138428 [Pavlovales sp. CCMP2436]|nr:hypothetical protein T492DRAFT_1138428 [Pavlovales sp. CCMP2436]